MKIVHKNNLLGFFRERDDRWVYRSASHTVFPDNNEPRFPKDYEEWALRLKCLIDDDYGSDRALATQFAQQSILRQVERIIDETDAGKYVSETKLILPGRKLLSDQIREKLKSFNFLIKK